MPIDIQSISIEIDKSYKNIIEFIEICKPEKLEDSSYQDWSYKDVLAHLARWISFSADKLQSIVDKVPFNDVDDFRKANRVWYEEDKEKELKNVESSLGQSMTQYKEVINGFSKKDLIREDLPLGFKIELWRYIVMDGVTHPSGHLLYHYLKRRNYWYFLKVLESTEDIYSIYSNGNNKVYSFEEYEDTNGMVKERMIELDNTYRDKELLNKVIAANQ
jgi:hypothetical protein